VDGQGAIVPVAGGSCLNIAVGMVRLGAPAGFFGGISTDQTAAALLFAPHALGRIRAARLRETTAGELKRLVVRNNVRGFHGWMGR
jgi:hypothetical protein